MLSVVLLMLFVLTCIVLVVSVLLQPGKADAGALFTSSISSTAFGPRGTQTILAKITIGAAAAFLLIALALSLPALSGSHSVLQSQSENPSENPSPSPAASSSPSPAASQEVQAPSPAASNEVAHPDSNKAATGSSQDKAGSAPAGATNAQKSKP